MAEEHKDQDPNGCWKCGCCTPAADLVNNKLCRSKQVCSPCSCFWCATCCSLLVFILLLWCFLVPALVANKVIGKKDCNAIKNGNTPSAFYTEVDYKNCDRFSKVNLATYFMNDNTYTDVTFRSRNGLEGLKGWWFRNTSAPTNRTVVLIHGMGSCKNRYEVLLPVSMLMANGFNALAFDVREHGDSPSVTGYMAAGCLEYPDMLGAFDFLLGQGVAADQIGFFANSLGTPSLLNAFREEPRITTGMWFDSPAYDFYEQSKDGINEVLKGTLPFGMVWHYMKQKVDCDLDERSAENGLKKGSQRAILPRISVACSEVDIRTGFRYAQQLAEDARGLGFSVSTYFYDTSKYFAWAGNVFPARKADTKCREHVTQELVNPKGYEAQLVAFFEAVL